jgi:hypothetical protein
MNKQNICVQGYMTKFLKNCETNYIYVYTFKSEDVIILLHSLQWIYLY